MTGATAWSVGQAGVDASTLGWGLVTQLGDTWLLASLAIVVYWLGPRAPLVGQYVDRERFVLVVCCFLMAVALTGTLKEYFAVARPTGALESSTVPSLDAEGLVAWFAGAQSYSLPSGHASGSTAVWGGLAWAIRWGSARARAAVVAAVVVAVSASRVALGVHTPVDVLAGIAVGLVVLALVLGIGAVLDDGRPSRAFGVVVGAGILGTAVVGPVPDVVSVSGLAAGAGLAWARWGDTIANATGRRAGLLAAVLGFVAVLPPLVGLALLERPVVVHAVVGAVGGVALIALPLVGSALLEKRAQSSAGSA